MKKAKRKAAVWVVERYTASDGFIYLATVDPLSVATEELSKYETRFPLRKFRIARYVREGK